MGGALVLFVLFVSVTVSVEIYRWHYFQNNVHLCTGIYVYIYIYVSLWAKKVYDRNNSAFYVLFLVDQLGYHGSLSAWCF